MDSTKHAMPPEAIQAYNLYIHGHIDRRSFMERVRKVAVSTAAAGAIVDALMPNYAAAQQVAPTDARIKAERVEFESPQGYAKVRGYLVRPASAATDATGALPTVLVVHENRGLNPHIEDITRRLALDNFIAFAPDALFPLGGYPGDEDKARDLFAKLDQTKTQEDFVASAAWLRGVSGANGKLGVVGFCYGGGVCNMLATRVPELTAAVPFYGNAPALDKVGAIKAQLLLFFAESDERINAAWPPYEAALKAAKVRYEAFKYPGTQHGFNNDTTPRYDANAAKQAWQRTVAFFNKTLRA